MTESSSGFGKATAILFERGGLNVVAPMRRPEAPDELSKLHGVLVSRLDVQDPASIDRAMPHPSPSSDIVGVTVPLKNHRDH